MNTNDTITFLTQTSSFETFFSPEYTNEDRIKQLNTILESDTLTVVSVFVNIGKAFKNFYESYSLSGNVEGLKILIKMFTFLYTENNFVQKFLDRITTDLGGVDAHDFKNLWCQFPGLLQFTSTDLPNDYEQILSSDNQTILDTFRGSYFEEDIQKISRYFYRIISLLDIATDEEKNKPKYNMPQLKEFIRLTLDTSNIFKNFYIYGEKDIIITPQQAMMIRTLVHNSQKEASRNIVEPQYSCIIDIKREEGKIIIDVSDNIPVDGKIKWPNIVKTNVEQGKVYGEMKRQARIEGKGEQSFNPNPTQSGTILTAEYVFSEGGSIGLIDIENQEDSVLHNFKTYRIVMPSA